VSTDVSRGDLTRLVASVSTHNVPPVERSFFHQVQDVFEGFVIDVGGSAARDRPWAWHQGLVRRCDREHYEAQLVRIDGTIVLEVGFHAEHPKVGENEAVLNRLLYDEHVWRRELGDEPEAGVFIGVDRWRRISEIWDEPDPDDVDVAIEIAARLADYVSVLEPLRRR
jgi:hypothetical protein